MRLDVRDLSLVGAFVGIVLFMLFGLTPSIVYGAGAAEAIVGTGADVVLPASLLGAIVSLLAMAGVFSAVGASMGAALGKLKKLVAR